MDYRELTLLQLHEALLKGEINPLDLTKEVLRNAKQDNNNAFEYISEKEALEAVNKLKNKDKNNLMWGKEGHRVPQEASEGGKDKPSFTA